MRFSPRQSLKFIKSDKAGKILGSLFLILGLGFLAYFAKVLIDAHDAKSWTAETATINSARLETYIGDNGVRTYSIYVAYEYVWKGNTYRGKHYRLHDNPSPSLDENNKVVEALLAAKQAGTPYPIFINPNDPTESAVKNVVSEKSKKFSRTLGLLFTLIGFFTLFRDRLFKKANG